MAQEKIGVKFSLIYELCNYLTTLERERGVSFNLETERYIWMPCTFNSYKSVIKCYTGLGANAKGFLLIKTMYF